MEICRLLTFINLIVLRSALGHVAAVRVARAGGAYGHPSRWLADRNTATRWFVERRVGGPSRRSEHRQRRSCTLPLNFGGGGARRWRIMGPWEEGRNGGTAVAGVSDPARRSRPTRGVAPAERSTRGNILNTATLTSSTPDPVTADNTNAASLAMKEGTGKK
jgi:hypothetical protein